MLTFCLHAHRKFHLSTFLCLKFIISFWVFQGAIWVLELEKVPKPGLLDKEQKRKKDFLEVIPVQKYAKIKDHCLILTETDGSRVDISLEGCTIAAVSATSSSSRKWWFDILESLLGVEISVNLESSTFIYALFRVLLTELFKLWFSWSRLTVQWWIFKSIESNHILQWICCLRLTFEKESLF